MLSRRRFSVLSFVAPFAAPGISAAQTPWPSRPIRWIVNFPPAGAADILSRTLAEYFGSRLGQPIIVENKPGAGGMLGADIVAKAQADGSFRTAVTPSFAALAFYGAIEQVLTGWIFALLPVADEDFDQAKDLIVETICGGLESESGRAASARAV